MIDEPIRYIDELVDCGADLITVHAESCKHLDRTIEAIKERGIIAGVALNPATPLTAIEHIFRKGGYGINHDSKSGLWRTEADSLYYR